MRDVNELYLSTREMLKLVKKVQSWQEVDGTYVGNVQNYQVHLGGRFSPPKLSVLERGGEWIGSATGANSHSGARYTKEQRAITDFYEKLRMDKWDLEEDKRAERVKEARRFISKLR